MSWASVEEKYLERYIGISGESGFSRREIPGEVYRYLR